MDMNDLTLLTAHNKFRQRGTLPVYFSNAGRSFNHNFSVGCDSHPWYQVGIHVSP